MTSRSVLQQAGGPCTGGAAGKAAAAASASGRLRASHAVILTHDECRDHCKRRQGPHRRFGGLRLWPAPPSLVKPWQDC